MEKETTRFLIIEEKEIERSGNSFAGKVTRVNRCVFIDDEKVYSDSWDAKAYLRRTDPIRECLRFVAGNPSAQEQEAEKLRNTLATAITRCLLEALRQGIGKQSKE